MAESSYWQSLLKTRKTRRATLGGAATLAGAAAVLAACNGGDGNGDTGSSGPTRTGLGTLVYDNGNPEEPVTRGGITTAREGGDLPSLDPYRQIAGVVQTFGGHVYSRLMKYKSGPGVDPGLADTEPDASERFEVADGGLTFTFKIRPNVKFHNIAPVSGRLLDAEDVVASYNRFSTLPAPQFGASFQGKVASVTAPDKNTVVFKLTRPNANFISLCTSGQFLWLMGKEAGVTTDPLQKPIGTGPWMLKDYLPSSRWEFSKHPEYWQTGRPYSDGIETYIVPEVSAYLAQFQTGAFPTFVPGLASDMKDIVEGKTNMRIYKGELPTAHGGGGFGRGDPNSPFLKDDRMRHAVSLAIDRDTIVEVINDLDGWKALGLEREYAHSNNVPAGLKKWYTDPRGPEMGDMAQWYQFDPQKGKQLVTAAGFPNGYNTEMHFAANNYAQVYRDTVTLVVGMLKEVGINASLEADDYGSVHNIRGWAGELPGLVWGISTGFADPDLYLDYLFGPTASRNQMKVNDPIFNDMFEKQNLELDAAKRRVMLIDIYKYLAGHMRMVPFSYGAAANYTAGYDWYHNFWAYRNSLAGQGNGTEAQIHRWGTKT